MPPGPGFRKGEIIELTEGKLAGELLVVLDHGPKKYKESSAPNQQQLKVCFHSDETRFPEYFPVKHVKRVDEGGKGGLESSLEEKFTKGTLLEIKQSGKNYMNKESGGVQLVVVEHGPRVYREAYPNPHLPHIKVRFVNDGPDGEIHYARFSHIQRKGGNSYNNVNKGAKFKKGEVLEIACGHLSGELLLVLDHGPKKYKGAREPHAPRLQVCFHGEPKKKVDYCHIGHVKRTDKKIKDDNDKEKTIGQKDKDISKKDKKKKQKTKEEVDKNKNDNILDKTDSQKKKLEKKKVKKDNNENNKEPVQNSSFPVATIILGGLSAMLVVAFVMGSDQIKHLLHTSIDQIKHLLHN